MHGEEMLKHISRFLLSSTNHPVPIAMAIEGLVALCRSEVTDVATLWGVLSSSQWKVVDDGRYVLCTVSLVPSVSSISVQYACEGK